MKMLGWTLLGVHFVALALGFFGIVVAIPHAGMWTSPDAVAFFAWALPRGGSMGMVTGALAIFFWGVATIGWRRTVLFAALSIAISAAAELTGTKTGWPFGGYEYLTLLGWKIMGRVPYGVPLSWFYMGFASYILAAAIVHKNAPRRMLYSVLLGTWLLTAWDLVLDPAMAALPQIKFWEWHEQGPYFGMPLRNLAGWFLTGFTFIGIARLTWRKEPDWSSISLAFPFAIYTMNIVWAILLALSAGLWQPAVAAVLLSIAPAALSLRSVSRTAGDAV